MIQTKIMNFFHTNFKIWLINTQPQNQNFPRNNATFLKKTLWKDIYKRSVLRNKFLKDSFDSNWQKNQKQNVFKIKEMYKGTFWKYYKTVLWPTGTFRLR